MDGEHPFVQRDFRVLHHVAKCDGELLAAIVALVEARAVLASLQRCSAHGAAMVAHGAIRPALRFKVLTRLVSVIEAVLRNVHGLSPTPELVMF